MYGGKNASYYIKCACIMLMLIVFFVYNLWQFRVSFKFYQHLQLVNELELPTKKVISSTGSSVALNFSQRDSPTPPMLKRSVGGTSAIIFVNGIDGQQADVRHSGDLGRAMENRRFM
jgi:hypothetical protein